MIHDALCICSSCGPVLRKRWFTISKTIPHWLIHTAGGTLAFLDDISSVVTDRRKSFVSGLLRFLKSVTFESRSPLAGCSVSLFLTPLRDQYRSLRAPDPRAGIVRNVSCEARRLACDDRQAFRLPQSSPSSACALAPGFFLPELFVVSATARKLSRSDVDAGNVFARRSNVSDFLLFP